MYKSIEDLKERIDKNIGPEKEKFGLIKNNITEAFKVAKTMPYLIQFFDDEIRDNDEVAKAIIESEPICLTYLSDRIKNDKKYAKMAIDKDAWAYTSIGDDLKSDKDLLINAVNKNVDLLAVIKDFQLIKNEDVMIDLLENNINTIKYIDIEKINKKNIEKMLSKNGLILEYLTDKMKDDKEIVLAAIKNNEESLEYSSPAIKKICREGEPIKILKDIIKLEKVDKVSVEIEKSFNKKNNKKGSYIYL